MKPIDLRSDTVTKPTPAMRAAMATAEVGDDVYGDDPTVNALQERIAAMLGFEAALFVPSGTMSNLCALMSHCARGDEYISNDGDHWDGNWDPIWRLETHVDAEGWTVDGVAEFGDCPTPVEAADWGTIKALFR